MMLPQTQTIRAFTYSGWIALFILLRSRDARALAGRVHRFQELLVAAGLRELVDEELHRFHRRLLVEELAEDPHLVQHRRLQQQLFLARPGLVDVDGREDAAVGQPAVEDELHVTRALE